MMKKWNLILLWFTIATAVQAQNMYIWQKGVYTTYENTSVGDMLILDGGNKLQVATDTYVAEEIDSITFTKPAIDLSDKVVICYKEDAAYITIPNNVTGLQKRISGADVTIISSTEDTEYEYVLCGSSNDGSFYFDGYFKCKFYLNNLSLTSESNGCAFDIQCGKRSEIILVDGTKNYLEDATGGEHNATLFCDGHLEFEGNGELYVKGNTNHAIRTKEYMKVKRTLGKLEVTAAANDGIHVSQYYEMNGGHVIVNNTAGDCLQVEFTKDATDEYNGEILINGGILDLNVCGTDVKGIKSDYDITITGGEINIDVPGAGSKGISSNNHLKINEINGPTNVSINATGGIYYDAAANDNVKCGGIKVDYNMTVDAGTITVTNTGASSYGIKVDGTFTNNGGIVNAVVE